MRSTAYRCSLCKARGHNAQRCPRRAGRGGSNLADRLLALAGDIIDAERRIARATAEFHALASRAPAAARRGCFGEDEPVE